MIEDIVEDQLLKVDKKFDIDYNGSFSVNNYLLLNISNSLEYLA